MPCLALPCLALPCFALPCLALPCNRTINTTQNKSGRAGASGDVMLQNFIPTTVHYALHCVSLCAVQHHKISKRARAQREERSYGCGMIFLFDHSASQFLLPLHRPVNPLGSKPFAGRAHSSSWTMTARRLRPLTQRRSSASAIPSIATRRGPDHMPRVPPRCGM